jgi:SAP domain-containing new25
VSGVGTRLSTSLTEAEFDNGYWYATELRAFAVELGIPSASKLRKDELERAIKHFLRTGHVRSNTRREVSTSSVRDVERGLRLDLPVMNYTSNTETKAFIEREAAKLQPGFTHASGTRYLLNRWREEQLRKGRRITYGDLVGPAIELNRTKRGPLRLEHGRSINFVSDFLAAKEGVSRQEALDAWRELKAMDAPKTYDAWSAARRAASPTSPRRAARDRKGD